MILLEELLPHLYIKRREKHRVIGHSIELLQDFFHQLNSTTCQHPVIPGQITIHDSQTAFFGWILLHPGRLTWNIIMKVWKIIFLSKWVIYRFHVSLPGCTKPPFLPKWHWPSNRNQDGPHLFSGGEKSWRLFASNLRGRDLSIERVDAHIHRICSIDLSHVMYIISWMSRYKIINNKNQLIIIGDIYIYMIHIQNMSSFLPPKSPQFSKLPNPELPRPPRESRWNRLVALLERQLLT